MSVPSLAFLSAKKLRLPIGTHSVTVRTPVPLNIHIPKNYRNYMIRTKKNILTYLRKQPKNVLLTSMMNFHTNSNKNLNIRPGYFRNENWRYYVKLPYNRYKFKNIPPALFYNSLNGPAFFLHPITGRRKMASKKWSNMASNLQKIQRKPSHDFEKFKKKLITF